MTRRRPRHRDTAAGGPRHGMARAWSLAPSESDPGRRRARGRRRPGRPQSRQPRWGPRSPGLFALRVEFSEVKFNHMMICQ